MRAPGTTEAPYSSSPVAVYEAAVRKAIELFEMGISSNLVTFELGRDGYAANVADQVVRDARARRRSGSRSRYISSWE